MTVHGCSFTNILSLNFITGFVRENIKACFVLFHRYADSGYIH